MTTAVVTSSAFQDGLKYLNVEFLCTRRNLAVSQQYFLATHRRILWACRGGDPSVSPCARVRFGRVEQQIFGWGSVACRRAVAEDVHWQMSRDWREVGFGCQARDLLCEESSTRYTR